MEGERLFHRDQEDRPGTAAAECSHLVRSLLTGRGSGTPAEGQGGREGAWGDCGGNREKGRGGR